MTFPSYPKYKDSGVEWLGEIPHDWDAVPFYSVAFERDESNKGMIEDNLLSLSYGRIVEKNIELNDGLLPESFETYQVTHPNDIIFRLTDLQNDKRSLRTAIVNVKGIITSAYIAAAPSKINAQFLNYLLRAYDLRKVFYSMGGGLRQSMKFSDIKRLPTVLPTPAEQTKIAAFLDKETTKIDALIAEQNKLVELLKEKRQGIISYAVTKGLNPKAKMKDSGVEWLGEVPEGWEVPSLGVLIQKAELGENYESSESNEGLPIMKMGNLDRGFIKLDKIEYLIDGIDVVEKMILRYGDFLFNTRNSLDLVGKVAIWRSELAKASYNSNILRLTFNSMKVATSAYMNYYFNSDFARSQLRSLAKGTTSVAAIYYKDLVGLRVMLPSADVQHAIVTSLDQECAQLDTLIDEANKASELLKERRSALISAAVTGKIDVRNSI